MINSATEALNRFLSLFRKGKLDRELDAELAAHLDLAIEEKIALGLSPAEARRQALIRFGGLEQAKELQRESRGLPALEDLIQDLRYSCRTLRRDAGFTKFAVLIVALGVGACCTVFSVINAVLIRPLPFRDPGRLVWIPNSGGEGLSAETSKTGQLLDLRQQNQSFAEVAGYYAFYGMGDHILTGRGEPERLTGVPVTQNFFPLLGVQPQLGRVFSENESRWNAAKTVILSHGFWDRRFAADPTIVGRSITLNGAPTTVVGILPPSFDFSSVFAPGSHIDLYFPFPLSGETDQWGNTLSIVGRLKPGIAIGQARAEMTVLGKRITEQHPTWNHFVPRLSELKEHVSGPLRPALLVLAFAVSIVMMIVCANISNLFLSRIAARQKENAIRSALGARRGRLIRQSLTESLLLSCCGASFGLVLAIFGTRLLARSTAVSIPLLASVTVDGVVLGFTLLLALVTGVVFGLLPAIQIPAAALNESLKDSHRGSSGGKQHAAIRNVLVVSEIAFACILLVGAGLLIRSFLHLLDVDLGFRPAQVAALRIDPSSRYASRAQKNAYFSEALRLARTIQGVKIAGLTDCLPLGSNRMWGAAEKGKYYRPDDYPGAFVRIVSEGYLKTMGIALIAGRDISERDTPETEPVIVINQALARDHWPLGDALGKLMDVDSGRRVVGVVGNVRHLSLEKDSGFEMYLPIRQTDDHMTVQLVVRTTGPNANLASDIRNALKPIEPDVAGNDFRTLQQIVDKSVSPRNFVVWLLAGFAGFALLLASLGIYGVIAYSVSQKTQEIGIRMALGASAHHLQRSILGETLRLTLVGMVAGSAVSLLLARMLSGILFGVSSSDPLTFGAMLLLLTGVAALAGYLPARGASRIDPMLALRSA